MGIGLDTTASPWGPPADLRRRSPRVPLQEAEANVGGRTRLRACSHPQLRRSATAGTHGPAGGTDRSKRRRICRRAAAPAQTPGAPVVVGRSATTKPAAPPHHGPQVGDRSEAIAPQTVRGRLTLMARLRHRATTHRQTRGCPDDMPALQGGRSGEEPPVIPFLSARHYALPPPQACSPSEAITPPSGVTGRSDS